MMFLREAYGENGNNVLFVQIPEEKSDVYAVYLYNHRTKHTVANFYHTLAKDLPDEVRQEWIAEGITAFEEACEFMGLEVPEDEAGIA